MTITLNGEPAEVPDGITVAELLQDPVAHGVAVAVNGSVVPRAAHVSHQLEPADDVEIVTAVAGG